MQEGDDIGGENLQHAQQVASAGSKIAASAEERTVQDVLESLGGVADDDVTLKVWRRDRRNGSKEWCADYTLADLPLESVIAEQHGGGHYVVQVWLPNPGRRGASPRGSATIRISDSVRPAAKQVEASASPQINVEQLVEKLAVGITSALQPVLAKVAAPAASPINGISLEQLATLQKLFGGAQQQKDPIQQMREFAELKKVMAEVFGEGGGGDDTLDRIGRIFEGMKELAQQRAAVGGAAAVPGIPSPDDIDQEAHMLQMVIREQLAGLCFAASSGSNATQSAQLVMERIPEQYDSKLLEILGETDAEAVNNLVAIYPGVEQHRAWFTSFCAAMRNAYEPDDAGGNLTNTGAQSISAGEGSKT